MKSRTCRMLSLAIPVAAIGLTASTSSASVLLNLDAKNLALADGAPVPTWGTLSQGTATAQPTFSATGMNGNPTVDFDNNSDFLQGGALAGARSVIMVNKFQDGGNLATASSNDNDSLNVRRNNTTNFYRSEGQTGDNNDFYRHAGHAGFDNLYVNSVPSGTFTTDVSHITISNAGAPASYTAFTLGRASAAIGRYWGGQISEVYVLDKTLTNDEIVGISSILAEEWGSAPVAATPAQRAAGLAQIPEPGSLGLVAAALGTFGLRRKRRGQSNR